ncbi:MAG: helix-turn-helix transcriptional regulator [Burkholderiales bacterium]|nr:helix-turn-helix transcriptional regulator [Burkholderiales bacterium]
MDVNTLIASRVRQLRDAQGLSLEALAELSGVSRSNISLIESGRSSPTAVVLDKLTAALGTSLSSLFQQDVAAAAPPSPLARLQVQPVWTDPASGYVRRTVSPAVASPLQLVDVVFPPGKRVALDNSARDADVHQQVWMIEGTMELTVGDDKWRLQAGDCLAMKLDAPIVFRNPTREPARYLVALAAVSPTRRTR